MANKTDWYFQIEQHARVWRWFLVSGSGREMARYIEPYQSRSSCIAAVTRIARQFATPIPVKDAMRKYATIKEDAAA